MCSRPIRTFGFAHDHSHRPVLAPGRADLDSLAALPSTCAIETRLLPSFDSCAPAQFDLAALPIYVARAPAAPFSPLPTVALPSMSLSPNAPFPHSRRVLCRFSQKPHSISRFAHLCRSIPVGFIRGNCERSEAVTSLKRLHSVSVAYSVTSGSHTSLAAAEANDFESHA